MEENQSEKRVHAEIEVVRSRLSDLIHQVKQFAAQRHPEAGPEFTIAQRALEDARMRIGRAQVKLLGKDPDANVIDPEKVKEQ